LAYPVCGGTLTRSVAQSKCQKLREHCHLHFITTYFDPKGDSVPPELFANVCDEDDDPEDLETVVVLAVFSDQEHGFERRPMQEKWTS